jgi:hypothetical protein
MDLSKQEIESIIDDFERFKDLKEIRREDVNSPYTRTRRIDKGRT